LEQFVLPTEPCDHVLSYEGTSRYCQSGGMYIHNHWERPSNLVILLPQRRLFFLFPEETKC